MEEERGEESEGKGGEAEDEFTESYEGWIPRGAQSATSRRLHGNGWEEEERRGTINVWEGWKLGSNEYRVKELSGVNRVPTVTHPSSRSISKYYGPDRATQGN